SGRFDLADPVGKTKARLLLGREVDLDVDGFREARRVVGAEPVLLTVDDQHEAEDRLTPNANVGQIPRPESATVGPHAHSSAIELDADTQRTVTVAESLESAVESVHQPVVLPCPSAPTPRSLDPF